MFKVTGAVNGGEHDGKRFALLKGFKRKYEAEEFIARYNKKQGRRFRQLRAEKEE